MNEGRVRSILRVVIGAFALLFGVMTIKAGGSVVFDVGTARADHGAYVPFVLYFNFFSGFPAVIAGVGTALGKRWAAPLAALIAVAGAVTFAGLGAHIGMGGAYEAETVIAMTVRLFIWSGIAAFNWKTYIGQDALPAADA